MTRARLVNHDIRAVLLLLHIARLLLSLLVTVGRARLAIVHLHIVLTALFLILLLAFGVLDIDVLTAIRLALIVFRGRACSLLATGHCGVFALDCSTLSLLVLFILFFDSVLVTVCVKIGLRLLRRVLRRCRLLRIPALVRSNPLTHTVSAENGEDSHTT